MGRMARHIYRSCTFHRFNRRVIALAIVSFLLALDQNSILQADEPEAEDQVRSRIREDLSRDLFNSLNRSPGGGYAESRMSSRQAEAFAMDPRLNANDRLSFIVADSTGRISKPPLLIKTAGIGQTAFGLPLPDPTLEGGEEPGEEPGGVDSNPAASPIRASPFMSRGKGWQLYYSVPAWLPDMSGKATLDGSTAALDLDFFGDIVELLKYVFTSYVEVRNDRWAIWLDVLFMKIEGGYYGGFDGPPLDVAINVDAKVTTWLVELAVAYQIAEWTYGPEEAKRRATLELYGGLRYWYIKNEIDADIDVTITLPDTPLPLPDSVSKSAGVKVDVTKAWADPIVGFRFHAQLTRMLALMIKGDIGGFGWVSDITYKMTGILNVQLTDRFNVYGGYQYLKVDYEDGSGSDKFEWDVIMKGPIIGFGWIFGGPSGEPVETTEKSETTLAKL